jgi:LL-diaminopimelate aminotransferase
MLKPSVRLASLPPYSLAGIFAARDAKRRAGVDVIDLGVGNPDLRPPVHVIDALHRALDDTSKENHRYPPFDGIPEFREAIAAWYEGRFGVTVDPAGEAIALVGSKEGIGHFLLSYVSPGDVLLLTTPCYPAYLGAARIAQAEIFELPLRGENGFRPDLAKIPADVLARAKVIAINYPNHPTTGLETRAFYERLFAFAREHDLFVISDIPYCDLSLDPSYRAMSFLEVDRAKERTVEFHSTSKSYSMQGWRVGFATGNREALAGLVKLKANLDYGVFMAIQRAAAVALTGPQDYCRDASRTYAKRRDAFLESLGKLGWNFPPPKATLYVWAPVPPRYRTSGEFASDLLEKTGVLVVPGTGFGATGEGYVRVSLTVTEERLREAGRRMEKAAIRFD